MIKGTTRVGFRNGNDQVVVRATGVRGTDHNQKVYALKCARCGEEYGANGSDIHIRRCPHCDDGRPGLALDEPSAPTSESWSVADAKARLSELLDDASRQPQTVTRNGKPVAVVVGIEEWKRRTARKGTLADFFMSSPLRGSGIDLERIRTKPRDIDL